MSESIVISQSGDTVTVTTETTTGGLLLSKMELLSLLERFVGDRQVFYRRPVAPQPKAEPVNWLEEMARSFGVCAFDMSSISSRFIPDSPECWDCGRLVDGPGMCGDCADRKAGML